MASETLIRKLNKEIKVLRQDVAQIKGALVDTEGDVEGKYRRAFMAKVLKRSGEKAHYRYHGSESFLRHVRASAK